MLVLQCSLSAISARRKNKHNHIQILAVDIDVSKYHKINLGKTIFWLLVLKTPWANYKKIQNW